MESTNFFTQIASLGIEGYLQITIAKGAEESLIVSVLPINDDCGDNAKSMIVPLNLRGTAFQLDEVFFQRIAEPLQAASGLMVNMETFMKQLEEAKQKSAMEKEKADREKKAKEERDKKFKDAMAKADELEKEDKFREAWIKVPDPADFPEHADTIRKRKSELSAKFSAPSLF